MMLRYIAYGCLQITASIVVTSRNGYNKLVCLWVCMCVCIGHVCVSVIWFVVVFVVFTTNSYVNTEPCVCVWVGMCVCIRHVCVSVIWFVVVFVV